LLFHFFRFISHFSLFFAFFSLNFRFASIFSLNFHLFYLRFRFRFLVFRIKVNHVKSGIFFASKRNEIFASISNFAPEAKVRAHPTSVFIDQLIFLKLDPLDNVKQILFFRKMPGYILDLVNQKDYRNLLDLMQQCPPLPLCNKQSHYLAHGGSAGRGPPKPSPLTAVLLNRHQPEAKRTATKKTFRV
jgi:hypothetical protein